MRKIKAAVLCTLLTVCTHAETFRVGHMYILPFNTTVSAGLNDAVAIQLAKENREYVSCIDIELKLPSELMEFYDSTAYMIYTDIAPEPAQDVIDYSGSRVYTDILPVKLSTTLRIPAEDEQMKSTPYETVLPIVVTADDQYIFVRFQQVMKGIPDEVMQSHITVSAKPVYKNIGKLELAIAYPETQAQASPYTIFIDDEPASLDNNSIYLDTGIHHLAVVSDYYRNEVRTFNIEQAKTTTLAVSLQEIVSTIQITAPETAVIELDGVPWQPAAEAVEIEPGSHSVRFTVGDYEAEKTFTVINGKSYVLSLVIDIQITENP